MRRLQDGVAVETDPLKIRAEANRRAGNPYPAPQVRNARTMAVSSVDNHSLAWFEP